MRPYNLQDKESLADYCTKIGARRPDTSITVGVTLRSPDDPYIAAGRIAGNEDHPTLDHLWNGCNRHFGLPAGDYEAHAIKFGLYGMIPLLFAIWCYYGGVRNRAGLWNGTLFQFDPGGGSPYKRPGGVDPIGGVIHPDCAIMCCCWTFTRRSPCGYEYEVEAEEVIDGGVKKGDQVVIELAAVNRATGEPIERMRLQRFQLDTGAAASNLPGLIDGIIGMKVGEERTFQITIPADWLQVSIRGITTNLTVKISELIVDSNVPAPSNDVAGNGDTTVNIPELSEKDVMASTNDVAGTDMTVGISDEEWRRLHLELAAAVVATEAPGWITPWRELR
mmetsp:Transcript_30640/g.76201  ORF Transcript_30640/g.76201 Transcript_30640/m.76201 type:complete len:335 (-) Transcript_30640:291-1295(-)